MKYWLRPLPERTVVHRLKCRMAWKGTGSLVSASEIPEAAEDCRICGGRYEERKK